MFPRFESEGRAKVQAIHAVAGEFPVHQVLGVHQLHSGVHMHRRAGEVVIVADADDVGVLELLVEQGIGVGSVAVVGGPVLRRSGRKAGAIRRSGCESADACHDQACTPQRKSESPHRMAPQARAYFSHQRTARVAAHLGLHPQSRNSSGANSRRLRRQLWNSWAVSWET